jgi:DMSO/TMAO reductase YedYZ molybdopterin-dependent catalytic subunit
MTTSADRPVHDVPPLARQHAANPILRVDGLVDRPLALTPGDLASLPRMSYLGALSCVPGGPLPEDDWTGMTLADLVALAGPRPEARFVRVSAGSYATPVALDDCARVLLCDRLAGETLTPRQGAPWRLVIPGSRFYASIKWVDRLELTADCPDNVAEQLVQAREEAGDTHCGFCH